MKGIRHGNVFPGDGLRSGPPVRPRLDAILARNGGARSDLNSLGVTCEHVSVATSAKALKNWDLSHENHLVPGRAARPGRGSMCTHYEGAERDAAHRAFRPAGRSAERRQVALRGVAGAVLAAGRVHVHQ